MEENEKTWERENKKFSIIINIINYIPFLIIAIISYLPKMEDQETVERMKYYDFLNN